MEGCIHLWVSPVCCLSYLASAHQRESRQAQVRRDTRATGMATCLRQNERKGKDSTNVAIYETSRDERTDLKAALTSSA